MTPAMIFIVTTAISLLAVVAIVVAAVVRRRKRQHRTLLQRVQHLERRELAAANAARDLRAELSQVQTSLAHNQRLLINNLTRSGRASSATGSSPASRDERKLRDMLPQE